MGIRVRAPNPNTEEQLPVSVGFDSDDEVPPLEQDGAADEPAADTAEAAETHVPVME